MDKFYYGNDEGQPYWINLAHVCFIKLESDKLVLKLADGSVVGIDGEDFYALKQVLWNQTINWEEEYKDNDKRHNHEDIPPLEEVKKAEIEEEWGRPLGSYLDDNDLNDYEIDDDEIPI